MFGTVLFENILSIRALEWLVILVGCKGKNALEAKRILKLIGLIMFIIIQKVNIKVSK